jgi:hypothetical protein
MLAPFSDDQIREAVRAVVKEERGDFRVESWRDAFAKRFATTKGGSHNSMARRKGLELPRRQLNKRNYAESIDFAEVWDVKPGGFVSVSEKLEHAKTRAIYSLDSENYFRFDAPARAVERCWKNKRAVLQPSKGMESETIESRARSLGKYKMMFDYADFNSAHTMSAQKIVVEEAFRGMDARWLDWLVRSYDNMWIRDPRDGVMRRMEGTLCSGHRLTTITNTILNAAYIRLALGVGVYNRLNIQHVGDDVVASVNDIHVAEYCVEKIVGSGLNMRKDKQAFGTVCAEFLRISYNDSLAVGYFPRSISSAVSGSWVSLHTLNFDQ